MARATAPILDSTADFLRNAMLQMLNQILLDHVKHTMVNRRESSEPSHSNLLDRDSHGSSLA
jgi:hypothetical protein